MLQKIRDKTQGWFAGLIVALIMASFVLWGLGDYLNTDRKQTIVAKLGNVSISWAQVDTLVERFRRQYQDRIPESTLRKLVVDQLIEAEQFEQGALALGFGIGKEGLSEKIEAIPEFQEDGHFSPERYHEVLYSLFLDDRSFRKQIRQAILQQQLAGGIIETAFSLNTEQEKMRRFQFQEREGNYLSIPLAPITASLKIENKDLEAYFAANQSQFISPERVKLQYVVLSADSLVDKVTPAEEVLKHYYEENQDQFKVLEQVHLAHIMLPASEATSKELEDLRTQLLAGADFATIAKAYSQDQLSAEKGGDLGWVVLGEIDPIFEKAAFDLKNKGDLSEIVKTPFGLHLIKLLDREGGQVKPFAEVKGEILNYLQEQNIEEQFAVIAEKAAQLAFESRDSLKEVADSFHLTLEETGYIDRQGHGLSEKLRQSSALLDTVFAEEMISQRNNSELLELDPRRAVIVRIMDHKAARPQTLAENHEKVLALVKAEEAAKKADFILSNIKEKLAQAKESVDLAALVKASEFASNIKVKSFSNLKATEQESNLAPELMEAIFKLADPSYAVKQPVIGSAQTQDGTRYLIQLSKVTVGTTPTLSTEETKQFEKYLSRRIAQGEYQAILQLFNKLVPVKRFADPAISDADEIEI
jgi:peptidyl-prolyl cis-trans isomerase D